MLYALSNSQSEIRNGFPYAPCPVLALLDSGNIILLFLFPFFVLLVPP